MMNFPKIPKRATRITVTQLNEPSGAQGYYDADGRLITATSDTLRLWAHVMDNRSLTNLIGSQQRNIVDLALNVDTKSAKNLKVGQELTTDRDNRRYAIVDFYDDEWKFSTVVVAKHIQ